MNASFEDYASAGFAHELLPLIPVGATISQDSPSFRDLVAARGKVPGKKRGKDWVGFGAWTKARPTPNDLRYWSEWGAGIGMQGRRFPALDIDVDDADLAEEVEKLATDILGIAPVRFGRAPRRVLVFSASGLGKRRLAFRKPGGLEQAVELLATGQHYVVEGVHPRTQQPYFWREGKSPVHWGADSLTQISREGADELYRQLEGLIDLHGYEVTSRLDKETTGARSLIDQQSLRAPSVNAVSRALAGVPNEADYDTWLKVGAAVKAACGSEADAEALDVWMDWSLQWPDNTPDVVLAKWESLRAPFAVGWEFLRRYAAEQGEGRGNGAASPLEASSVSETDGTALSAMFAQWVWVERLKRACEIATGELFDREQFNARNARVGPPSSTKDCAWSQFLGDFVRRTTVKSVTYRPGAGAFVEEDLPGLVGTCINTWRDPAVQLPETATDEDASTWLDHVAFIVPDEREREILLNWLAWIVQNPGRKPNWAVLIGSTWEGLGKDMLLEPVRLALGAANVREVGPGDLMSSWTWWAARTRLVIVEEMQTSERKATMNRLKPLVAAPPYTLTINKKMEPQYEVPNLIAAVFFSNMENALAVSKHDRRFLILWNDGHPRESAYYADLHRWYKAGGREKAAKWLLLRDVSAFEPVGRAPATAAKDLMAMAARPIIDELIGDDAATGEGIFARRLFAVEEAAYHLRLLYQDRKVSTARITASLRQHGFAAVGRVALGRTPAGCQEPAAILRNESTVFGRADDLLRGADPADIRSAYWAERRSNPEREVLPFPTGVR